MKETKWTVTRKSGDNCCVDDCVITLKEENTPLKRPLGDVTVSLIRSPYENLYNFSAVYDPIEMVWQEPVKEDYMNIANIVTSVENGSAQLEIRQPCLPSGIYSFKIISQGCGRMDTTVTFRFNDVYTTEIVSEVHHNETRRCAFLQVVYDGGEANLVKQSTDLGNGADLDPVVIPCNTQIKVVKGEAGGYTKNAVYGLKTSAYEWKFVRVAGVSVRHNIPHHFIFYSRVCGSVALPKQRHRGQCLCESHRRCRALHLYSLQRI